MPNVISQSIFSMGMELGTLIRRGEFGMRCVPNYVPNQILSMPLTNQKKSYIIKPVEGSCI